jgi:hypothetical protein
MQKENYGGHGYIATHLSNHSVPQGTKRYLADAKNTITAYLTFRQNSMALAYALSMPRCDAESVRAW